jgi:hypothetical protein
MAALLGAVAGATACGDPLYCDGLDAVPFDVLMSSVMQGHAAWEVVLRAPPPLVLSTAAAVAGALTAAQAQAPVALPASAASCTTLAIVAVTAGALRCLDGSHHTGSCDVCLPPPLEGEEGARSARRRSACRRAATLLSRA